VSSGLLRQVNHLDRVVPERRDVQPLGGEVDGKVVEAAFDAGQRH